LGEHLLVLGQDMGSGWLRYRAMAKSKWQMADRMGKQFLILNF